MLKNSTTKKSAAIPNVIPADSKQSFDTVISAQHLTGYWSADKASIF